MAKKEKRFEVIHTESTFFTESRIIVDTVTGVNYLYVGSGQGGGITPLLDREGRPIVSALPLPEKD